MCQITHKTFPVSTDTGPVVYSARRKVNGRQLSLPYLSHKFTLTLSHHWRNLSKQPAYQEWWRDKARWNHSNRLLHTQKRQVLNPAARRRWAWS